MLNKLIPSITNKETNAYFSSEFVFERRVGSKDVNKSKTLGSIVKQFHSTQTSLNVAIMIVIGQI